MFLVRVVAMLVITYGCTGCIPLLTPLGPREGEIADLPFEVALVEQMGNQFEQEPGHPLLDVDLGTVIDDLSNLGGCWGTHTSREDTLVRADTEFYRFDLQRMEMTHQLLTRGIPDEEAVGILVSMNFDLFTESVSSIQSVGDDHITVLNVSNRFGVSSNAGELPPPRCRRKPTRPPIRGTIISPCKVTS